MSGDTDLLPHSMLYARRGWPVFPLFGVRDGACECARSQCDEPSKFGKHPRTLHGFQDASTDEEAIRRWWTMWPSSNVGIATGDGLVVIDVDPRSGGEETLEALSAGHVFPRTPTVYTGGGGLHLYFSGQVEHGGTGILGPGLDVKAVGGYVVAPPSLHGSGERYAWLVLDDDAPPLPRWLRPPSRVVPKQAGSSPLSDGRMSSAYVEAALAQEVAAVRTAPIGSRNDQLNRSAYALFRLVNDEQAARRVGDAL